MISLTINGVTYSYPQTGDLNWGDGATNWASAVTTGMLSLAGGSFPLTSQVDFGSSFGIKSIYYLSRSINSAATGVLRLANADGIAWRNTGNSADILLKPDADGFLQYNSIDLVNLSGTQTLTNKTISGASNTLTNINVSSLTGTLGISAGGTGQTTAAAAFSALSPITTTGDMIYSSSGTTAARLGIGAANQIIQSVGGVPTWATVPAGGINYISANPNAEVNTTGWVTYANTAGNTPVTGTGGSPTSTWTRSTSTPLRGTGSFLWTKAGSANRQGEGVAYAFTIDNADQAKALAITCDYQVASGTFTASNGTTAPLNDGTTSTTAGNSDLEFFIYDVTNSVLIPVTPQVLSGNSANSFNFKAVFQTASNSTSYLLIIHTATTTTNNFTIKFDNLFVGPQSVSYGPPETDWVAYTPTITGFGTPTAVSFYSRRSGPDLLIRGQFTSGTSTAVQAQVTIGYNGTNANVVASSLVDTNSEICGQSALSVSSASTFYMSVNASTNFLLIGVSSIGGSNGNFVTSTGNSVYFWAKVPIQGWSSTVLMSNDTDSRVVAASVVLNTSATPGSNTNVKYDTILYDTHGGYNPSTGNYTVPVSGYFRCAVITEDTGSGSNYLLTQNGTQKIYLCTAATASVTSGSATLKCVTGDTISVQISNGNTINGGTPYQNVLSIERVSGPSAVAATETVVVDYTDAAAGTVSTLAVYPFATKVTDSHGAYNATTGIFTTPSSGTYSFAVGVSTTGVTLAATAALQCRLTKNVSTDIAITLVNGNAATSIQYSIGLSRIVRLVAGDTVSVRLSCGTSTTLQGAASENWLSIVRVGN